MEEQNIPATTEEVMVASSNDKLIKMNLQLFGGKRDGKERERVARTLRLLLHRYDRRK